MEAITKYDFNETIYRELRRSECEEPVALLKKGEKANIVLRASNVGHGNISNVPKRISYAWFYTWGYSGMGPYDLAMNILFHWTGDFDFAVYWSGDLVGEFIGQLENRTALELSGDYISRWVEGKRAIKSDGFQKGHSANLCPKEYVWNNEFKMILRPSVLE